MHVCREFSIFGAQTNVRSGTGALRAHVDIELHCFCRISVADDAVEGQSPLEAVVVVCSFHVVDSIEE